jgi:hypothetical protein
MNDYYDKDGSFLIRKKLRARTYDTRWRDNPERVWLEVKHKRNMNIRKVRAEISPETWAALVRGAPLSSPSFSSRRDEEGFREFFYHFKKELYRPSVIVQYLRTAYLGVFTNPIRITFDRHIMVCRADDPLGEERMVPVSGSTVIMEVKYNRLLPWWFTRLVRGFGLSRDDYSKYRNAVALFRGYHRIPISK